MTEFSQIQPKSFYQIMVFCCGSTANAPKNKSDVEPKKTHKKDSGSDDMASDDMGMQVVVGLLKDVPILSRLTTKERKKLASKLEQRSYNKNENLMVQGEIGTEFFVIIQGEADVLVEIDGTVEKVTTLRNMDYCGEQALINEGKRSATIKCTVETNVLVLNKGVFKHVVKDSGIMFAKRDAKRAAVATENLDGYHIDESKDTKKTEEIVMWLLECIKDVVLFENLSEDQRKVIVKYMYKEPVKKDAKLIIQGQEGNKFYVVEDGGFDVHVDKNKVASYERGDVTGELSLMYNAPRSASVTATTDGSVWVMERQTYRKALMDHNKALTTKNIEFLQKVPLLQPLLSHELALVDQALQSREYVKGYVIVKQGDMGNNFYIVQKGTCTGTIEKDGVVGEEFTLTPGQFFGERALLTDEARAATIVAGEDVVCLWLPRKEFTQLLGPLDDIMNRNMEEYKKPANERNLLGDKSDEETVCKLDDLKVIGILGKGAFGVVKLVVDPETKEAFALKAIRKCQVVELGQESHIVNEKKVMAMMSSRFLVNLRGSYKDKWRVYLLLQVCLGGELFTILRKMRSFDEPTSRFFAACVIEAFAYMHSINVIYRDLKPENLVLHDDGYLKVTDFGFAKVVINKTFTLCGTPDYLSPEIVTGQGHGKGVDWWTLGVLIYEMLASFPPFFDDEPMMTYRKIISCKFKFPKHFSPSAKDIVSRLLKPRPTKRLGVIKGGAKLLRDHAWYFGFTWAQLNDGTMPVPIKTEVKGTDDLSNFEPQGEDPEVLKFDASKHDMSWVDEF